jgi:hypothetical protein
MSLFVSVERIERRYGWRRSPPASFRTCHSRTQLVHLYAERGSPKYERAAMRWLERYMTENSPRLRHLAEVAADLARREA